MGFMDSLGSSLGNVAGNFVGDTLGSITGQRGITDINTRGTNTQKKVLSQDAINKLIYDVLSSDQGLSALASGENISGGFNSSTKGLMAQDLVTKLVGELANVTAETVATNSSHQSETKKKGVSVICTELHAQGYFTDERYEEGQRVFQYTNKHVMVGYQLLAAPIVSRMKVSPRVTRLFYPLARAHYAHHINAKRSFLSLGILALGYPLCFLVGTILALIKRIDSEMIHYGRTFN